MNALHRFFSKVSALPPAPRVVDRLLAQPDDRDVDVRAIAALLSRDAALREKILRVANSGCFGVWGTVETMDEALRLLGLLQVQVIAISCDVAGAFATTEELPLAQFWRTSLLTGLIARALASRTMQDPRLAFTAGLMHGLGLLLVYSNLPEVAEELDKVVDPGDVQARRMAEHEVLGVDHCEIGAELARRWDLPAPVANAIRYYGEPDAKAAEPLARLLYVAASITYTLEREEDAEAAITAIPPAAMRALAIDPGSLLVQLEGFRSLASEMADLL